MSNVVIYATREEVTLEGGSPATFVIDGKLSSALPPGGNEDQVLVKLSDQTGDVGWRDPAEAGGTVTSVNEVTPDGLGNVELTAYDIDADPTGTATTVVENHETEDGAHNASVIAFTPAGNIAATRVSTALAELDSEKETPAGAQAKVDTHVNDSSAAHAASAISIADAGNDFTATDVEGALAELQSDHETDATNLSGHISDSSAAHAASAISFSATGTIAATNAQTAIAEVATDAASALSSHESDTTSIHGITDTSALETTSGAQSKVDTHVNDSSAAHAASAISFSATGTIAATDAQTAIAEVATDAASALSAKEDTANKGAANGYASLDSGGKVPIGQLPSSIMEYQGVWNASTNSPSLADGTGSTGDVYRVGTAGSRDLGSGSSISFAVGDYVIYNGSTWEKSDTTDAVATVFSRTGNVTAQNGDYTAAQITNTPAGNIAATTVQAAIDELDTEKQAASSALQALSGLTSAADKVPYFTGSGTAALATFTSAGRALVDDTDAPAQLVTLGALPANGWIPEASVPTYSSGSNTNTRVFTATTDATTRMSVGWKTRMTIGGTVYYGIITALTATSITCFMQQTEGVFSSTSNPTAFDVSPMKAPLGFPMDPLDWMLEVTSSATTALPTTGTWANTGAISLAVPLGAWRITGMLTTNPIRTTATGMLNAVAIGTATDGTGNYSDTVHSWQVSGASGTIAYQTPGPMMTQRTFTQSTTLYLLEFHSSNTGGTLYVTQGNIHYIRALSSYL